MKDLFESLKGKDVAICFTTEAMADYRHRICGRVKSSYSDYVELEEGHCTYEGCQHWVYPLYIPHSQIKVVLPASPKGFRE